jgi:hypothetical protein
MRADKLTRNLDENSGRIPSQDFIRDIEQKGTGAQPDFYVGSGIARGRGRFDAGLGRGRAEVDNEVLRQGELKGSFIKQLDPPSAQPGRPAKLWKSLTSKKVRGKTSLLTVSVLLFGGGGFLTLLFAPASAIVQMKEVLQSLNDQVKAMDSRSASIMRAKFKSTTTGSCGAVKIKCDMAEMSDEEAKSFHDKNPGMVIERENIVDGKGKISKLTFTDDTGKVLTITDANAFSDALANNDAFRAAWSTEYNPVYEGFSDPKAREVISKNKLSKNYDITGQNDEERQKKLNEIAGGQEDLGSKNITKQTDKDGNETYVDDEGKSYTKAEYDELNKIAGNVDALSKIGGASAVVANTAEKAVSIDAVGENVCTTWNFMRHVSAAAKTVKKLQLIRYALALVLTPADKIKAGDATEDATNFSGNTLMKSQPDSQVIDDSRLGSASSGSIPMISDPEKDGNAFDSPGYKQEESGIAQRLSSRASKFSLTGGPTAVLDAVETDVAKVVNGGNADPKEVSKKCGYIQNSLVRVGAFAAGIAAGVGTLGVATAIQAGLSVAWSLAQPTLEASLGDMMAGDVTKNIYGLDSGDATRVGMGGLGDIMAQNRGMPPVTSQDGIDYINQNRKTVMRYDQDQTYLARATPFDINNRYSFLGSMLFSMTPTIIQSRSSMSSAMMNMASLIPTTFASISTAHAADAGLSSDYFSCADPVYKSKDVHILADNFCVVRHWMPQSSLDLDPLENAQWMSDTGNIDPDSDTGEAKDNGQEWNYTKFMEQCVNRTQPMGEPQDENEGDGTNCYKPEYENLNMHFRTYTMDLTVMTGMKDKQKSSSTQATANSGTTKAKAGPNGWVFPTVASDLITRKFGEGISGVDIAGSSVVLTNQQPVYAAKSGVVIAAGPAPKGYGNWIVIQHDPDASGKVLYTVYANLDSNGVLVAANQKVNAGDPIGRIGSADAANGPHLRFEVWDGSPLAGGTAIDPTAIVEGARPQANTIGGV